MLKRFAEALFPSGPDAEDRAAQGRHTPFQLQHATCVVLLEAARVDKHFTDEERRHIVDVVRDRFDLSDEEAQELVEEATAYREESTDLWRFTNKINEHFSPDEKTEIIEEVWRVFYSDGTLDGHEDHLAHKLRNLLNLNHKQLIDAKLRVLDEIRGGQ